MGGFGDLPQMLDLTRLISRVGRRFSGIDRVEFEYLRYFSRISNSFGIVRTRWGYLILEQTTLHRLLKRFDLQWQGERLRKWKIMTELRFAAKRRASNSAIEGVLKTLFRDGFAYVNTGHMNHTDEFLCKIRAGGCSQITILLHDVIPLSYPEFQRSETVARFETGFRAVTKHADSIVVTTQSEAAQIEAAAAARGITLPKTCLAPLGADHLQRIERSGEDGTERPYFLCVGTIEPRKNHALLLDIWPSFSQPAADLLLVGARGWRNEDVFRALDRGVPGVFERNNVSDRELLSLMQGARALLFPSFAEGFGLPAVEAARAGVPVICSDIPVFREILGDYGLYCDPRDKECWVAAIEKAASMPQIAHRNFSPHDWSSHFEIVFKVS